MEISCKQKSSLNSNGSNAEHLSADLDLSFENLIKVNPGESVLAAFRRQEVPIVEEIVSFVSNRVVPDLVKSHLQGLTMPEISPGLRTKHKIDSEGKWTLSADCNQVTAKLHIEADLTSDQRVQRGESVLNARMSFASDIASSLIQQLKMKLFEHSTLTSYTWTNISAGPEGTRINKYTDVASEK